MDLAFLIRKSDKFLVKQARLLYLFFQIKNVLIDSLLEKISQTRLVLHLFFGYYLQLYLSLKSSLFSKSNLSDLYSCKDEIQK